MRILSFFLFVMLVSVSAGWAQTALPAADKAYLIGPMDELTGKVLGEPDFDFTVIVDENGQIQVPFSDGQPVTAMCKSERELRSDLTKLLLKYLKSPQLSLFVSKRNSRPPISVSGQVNRPAEYTLTRATRLADVIMAAGGVIKEKSGGKIQVFHTIPPICADPETVAKWKEEASAGLGASSQVYNQSAVFAGDSASNPEIFPGDVIVVPQADPVYVIGEVRNPGEKTIPEGGLPITQAIAMSAGTTEDAKKKIIKVYRRKPGAPQPEMIAVNFDAIKKGQENDFMLQPFDIVEVGKVPINFTKILTGAVTGLPTRIPIPIY